MTITVGILHPGDMGASVAGSLRSTGNRVVWASAGRSEATRARAASAGLEDLGNLEALLTQCEVVASICPPHAAAELAGEVAELEFKGIFVDMNAVSPATSQSIGRTVEKSGSDYVDGGIVGGPHPRNGETRIYLSGPKAEVVGLLFEGTSFEAVVIDGDPGAASALKMCFAAYTKGSTALLAAIRAVAAHEGVESELLQEWSQSIPELINRSDAVGRVAAVKAWRFIGEMHEIADTFGNAGLPDGFHRAAAEIYERLGGFKGDEIPSMAAVVESLLHPRSTP